MPLVYVPSVGTATVAGIFIPRNNLSGLLTDSELADTEPKIKKDCKLLASFLTTLHATITDQRAIPSSLVTALGLTITKGTPSGVDLGIFNQLFTASIAQIVDYETSTFYPIPVPTSGSNSGKGILKITDIFPDAVSVAVAGSISEAGVLIPHADLDAYGAGTATNPTLDEQSRQWFAAMLRYLFNEIPIRTTTPATPSALITKTLGTVSSFTLPTDALALTNPTTGLDRAKTTVNDVYFRSLSFNIQYELNEQTQSYDVRVV